MQLLIDDSRPEVLQLLLNLNRSFGFFLDHSLISLGSVAILLAFPS